MCGIFGAWHLSHAPVTLNNLQVATDQLRHRGPDDEGYLLVNTLTGVNALCGGPDTAQPLGLSPLAHFQGEAFDLALGFRRLAIIDLSAAGHQPMRSSDGVYWIVFNGEIYNYLELRAELQSYGYRFVSGSDTEIILAAYQQWGADCLTRFNGMWGLAIWDNQQKELFLARDRFGVKPLYYTHQEGRFAFASEIKALVGAHGLPFMPNQAAIHDYVVHDRLPNPQGGETFFMGVQALPPGHWLSVRADRAPTMHCYYTLPVSTAQHQEASPAQVVSAYRDLFTDAVRLRLQADVPVGTCLSGGLDSSSIVCVINRLITENGIGIEQVGQQQKTFSAVYNSAGRHNERPYIETVLAATGAAGNFTVPTLERLLGDFDNLLWHQDEPFGSTSIFAQWCVMAKVREQGVTVLLDGQGADETLAGYRPYLYFFSDLLQQHQWQRMWQEAQAMQANTGLSATGLLAQTLARQAPPPLRTWLGRHRRLEQANAALLNPAFAAHHQHATGANQRTAAGQETLSHHLQAMLQENRLPDLLRYEDRNSMAFSIEARTPFLDYRLVEFSFNQAADLRIHEGWTKWVLRKAMQDVVPAEIVWRKDKVGFETPQLEWLTALLKHEPGWFGSAALSGDYLNLPQIRQQLPLLVQQLPASQGLLWRLINLEAWLRTWKARTV